MSIEVVVREAEEGGSWAEPGCATQGETLAELMANIRDAVEGWLGFGVTP